jgi:3-hydroxyisobutyrate dehydrogenase-like beta-hydroxyacid dehydrogenase
VPDTPDVERVVTGPDGLLVGAAPGLLVIDTSTIAPRAARALAEHAAAQDVAMLDAPVSGGEQGAIAGTLSIMVGGRRDAFDRAAPIFAAIGRTATYMGDAGQGQMTKLVNQVVGAATLAAVAEGISSAPAPASARGARRSGRRRRRRRGCGPTSAPHAAARLRTGLHDQLQQKDLRLALAAAADAARRRRSQHRPGSSPRSRRTTAAISARRRS